MILDTGVIVVQYAVFGRSDRTTCGKGRPFPQVSNTRCSLRGTVDVVKSSCNGRRVCELKVRGIVHSDPCPGTATYLETTYYCLTAIHFATCEGSLAHLQCVADSCNGKNRCTISATNSEFGDPCGGTYKYLEVAYTCILRRD
ncbi:hypothetical protein NQZ68_000580 [Dissostichus eleginoides]|nr:hypothetical protein NQZ68_000580 [Dissostichus eleginoides]